MAKQTKHVHVLMDAETHQMLEFLAKTLAVSSAEVVRRLIRKSAKARGCA